MPEDAQRDANPEWRPAAGLEALRLRARVVARIRLFFARHGVLEVDTPALSAAVATDPHLHSFTTVYTGPGAPRGRTLYLHTSPEFPMKRLLAAGAGSIFQLCKVFRDGEAGRLHNPEFTLLEWYRVDFDQHRLMDEVEALVRETLEGLVNHLGAAERLSYGEAFQRHAGIDPYTATPAMLAKCARRLDINTPPGMGGQDLDAWRDLLLTHAVVPRFPAGRPVFVYDYPASQAALARVRPGEPPVAERFELYINGVELANGFHELGDADEQRRRFAANLARRRALGLAQVPPDERLLAALAGGLPDCSGVALGVDRLLMLAAGVDAIDQVLAFPWERA
ncbi:MAG: EF-P lysine aminoacylase GenX, partial [Gammaproteobacteria bacterium]|nr:EF-P lysine aminoacylase GenX [Gammaproteobacteria bacterium]